MAKIRLQYSTYGPSLNFLHNWSQTAWLTGFFLPHFTETSSLLINSLNGFGRILFLSGLCLFLIGAGQVYFTKFTKKIAVTDGLYRFITEECQHSQSCISLQ
ncbi:MAG: hypothetical protein ACE5I1_27340 [bacterium]